MNHKKSRMSSGFISRCGRTVYPVLVIFFLLSENSCRDRGKPAIDNGPQPGSLTYTDTGTSMVRVFDQNGRVCIQQSNTYYQLADVYTGTLKIPLLMKIKKTELCFADSVNKDKVFEIDAQSIPDAKNVQWKTQFVATDMLIKDNTLQSVHEGGESQEDFITRFSLQDGKEIFSCSYGELKVAIPNVREKRFLGYTSKKSATGPVQGKKEENLLGIIRYSSGSKPINVLNILLKRSKVAGKIPVYTPDMILVPTNTNTTAIEEGKSIILMKADEHYQAKDVSGFALQLTYYYGDDNESAKILIPVEDDHLDVAHAKFDNDIFEINSQ